MNQKSSKVLLKLNIFAKLWEFAWFSHIYLNIRCHLTSFLKKLPSNLVHNWAGWIIWTECLDVITAHTCLTCVIWFHHERIIAKLNRNQNILEGWIHWEHRCSVIKLLRDNTSIQPSLTIASVPHVHHHHPGWSLYHLINRIIVSNKVKSDFMVYWSFANGGVFYLGHFITNINF